MSDIQKDLSQKYAYLNHLSTDKLEELLRMAGDDEDEAASAYYDAIEEVILRRETESPTGRLSDLDASWAEFQRDCVPEVEGMRLHTDEMPGTDADEVAESSSKTNYRSHKSRKVKRFFLVAAVTVILCVFAARASGMGLLDIVQWSGELFHFGASSMQSEKETKSQFQDYDAIQAMVDECGIEAPVVPKWFPEGYELKEVSCNENESGKSVLCVFSDHDDGKIFFEATNYRSEGQVENKAVEKDNSFVEEYSSNNQIFYIFNNQKTTFVTWRTDNWYVSIDGTLSIDELKTMIDSIGG